MEEEMPVEIDFIKATRDRHHVAAESTVFLPASTEKSGGDCFSENAVRQGVGVAELLTDVLKRDIEINEALK